MGLLVEVFSGILAGGPYAHGAQKLMFTEATGPPRVGHFMMAIDPGRFGDARVFKDTVAAMVDDLHALQNIADVLASELEPTSAG